eukprot:CAMPEP_0179064610 /NCGR_PEP_ID=MMETSP0796-20121207/28035_1 /TAXON_ID=73915 /ORGANISM="Pyrodinium bahamense, Strain pbaha01" /LENGTH=301 /DNA_ID=CAMNT_0020761559 /DNA_START=51 /DNA_END=956 /DNA_ORIENTATION=-
MWQKGAWQQQKGAWPQWQQKGAWQQQSWGHGWATGAGQGELLWNAISETVAQLGHLETEWDSDKLEKKLREYMNKGAKNLNFRGKPLKDVVNEYADNALSSIFAGLGDREWLYLGQVDFTYVLDAGCKDHIPPALLNTVSQEEFEQTVIQAYARAFEEQRFGPILTEAVSNAVSGPKIKKKVWNAMDAGRKQAVASEAGTLEDFVTCWINSSIWQLTEDTQGSPDSVLEAETAAGLFHAMLQAGAVPIYMTQQTGPPPAGWPLVDEMVASAYGASVDTTGQGMAKGGWAWAPPTKKMKTTW